MANPQSKQVVRVLINKKVIQEFLDRPLNNYSWIKRETAERLQAALDELRPKPNFGNIIPWLHQNAVFLILLELQRFMLHVDMGGGKTLISLMLLLYRKQRGEKPKAIVFVPYITSVSTWIDEVEERAPSLKCVPLLGTGSENLRTLQNTPGDLFVICYQSAVAMVTEIVPSKKRGKNQWQLKAAQVREYFAGFDTIIMDEIHKAKSVTKLTYRMCRAISAQCDWALGLTGTPFNKDLADLWPQFYLVDFGETLGPTFGFYRDAFFEQKPGYFGGYEYKFKKKLMPVLQRTIKHSSISYDINELHDMPPRKYVVKQITANVGQFGYAEAAKKKIKEAVANSTNPGSVLQVVESNYLQLRQLSSGFMTLKGEDAERVHVQFDDNPKLDHLVDCIEAMPKGRKMVVFHHFVHTNRIISDRLTELKIGHARVWSGAKDPLGELRRFKRSDKCPVLLINWKSGSSSLNLQFANYLYCFEQPDSAIDRQQGERRIWRPGQQHRVIIYDPFVRGTYDEAMNKSNKAGESLLKKLLRGK